MPIKKAIIIFASNHPDLYFSEDEHELFDDWEHWKDRLLEANSRLPKRFQESFDNSWISLHPRFNDAYWDRESAHLDENPEYYMFT